MEHDFSGQFAQSVTIHHYEKWVDVDFVHQMGSFIEMKMSADESNEFVKVLEQFRVDLVKQAVSHILDLSIQQHSTTSFSLSEYTLRNCLMYTLSRDLQLIVRIGESELSDWEKKQIYTVNVPNLAAALNMLFEHENKLPCIMHTHNIRNKFNESFKKLL